MRKKLNFTVSLIALLFWLGLIFWYSSRNALVSKNQSGNIVGILGKIAIYITGGKFVPGNETLQYFDHIIRKSAHFFIFFILGFLSLNLCSFSDKIKHKILVSIIFCVFCAVFDELHQYFVPGRASLNKDVIIDTCGSAGGIILYKFLKKY